MLNRDLYGNTAGSKHSYRALVVKSGKRVLISGFDLFPLKKASEKLGEGGLKVGKGKEHSIQFKESRHDSSLGDPSSSGVYESSALAGQGLCCVEEKNLPCLELELYSWEEPILCMPLNCRVLGANANFDCKRTTISGWVLQKVKDFRNYVGLSCERFEEYLTALLAANEASHQ
jgi:hypothetical protein